MSKKSSFKMRKILENTFFITTYKNIKKCTQSLKNRNFCYFPQFRKKKNFLGILRDGVTQFQFFSKIGQSKIAFINGQKCDETHIHNTIHKWGGNILSIYEGIGAPHSPVPFLFTKKWIFLIKK